MNSSHSLKKKLLIKDEIINSLAVPVILLSRNLKNISLNQKALQQFHNIDSFTSFTKKMSPAVAKRLLKNCGKVIETGKEKTSNLLFNGEEWQLQLSSAKKKGVVLLFHKVINSETSPTEDRYQQLLDAMGDSFVLTDEKSTITDVNNTFCKEIGYPREKLIGFNSRLFDKGRSLATIKTFQKQAEKGSVTFDTVNIDTNGRVRDAEVNMFLLKRNGKKYFGTIGRDITEYKKAQEEVKKINDRFISITNSTQDALWELNTETGERWANEVHQKLYGLTINDPMPESDEWEQHIHPAYHKQVTESLDSAIKKKSKHWNAEYWFKDFKGNWVFIFDRTLLKYNKEGKLVKMMGSMVDITQLKETQEELVKQNILSDAIVNSLPGIFFLINQSNQFFRWNKNLETVTGYSAKEIKRLQPHHFFSEKNAKLIYGKIQEASEKGWAEMEVFVQTKSKTYQPFYLSVSHITIEKEEYLIGIGSDISKVKEAQKKVRKMEAKIAEQKITEQKNISRAIIEAQEKERNFIGKELHDNVNQLLAGARLYLTMGTKTSKELAETVKYPIELLDSGIQEIRALTHRSITPSRDLDLKNLTEGLVDLLKAAGINCHLHYRIEGQLLDNCRTNIYRILQEAGTNIIKHSSAKNVALTVAREEDSLTVLIKDDGKGFNTNQTREGIGLTNIYNRVNAYNGKISITSAPGKGCEISIKMPLPDCTSEKK